MNINEYKKFNKPNNSKFKQGYYKVINIDKYIGDYTKVIYRSSLEYKFCLYCDLNGNVLKWSSEPIGVKYFNEIDNKYHTYYIDFFVSIKNSNEIKNYLVEIKPKNKLNVPKAPKVKSYKSINNYNNKLYEFYVIDKKRKSAEEYAKNLKCEYIIIDEDDLKKLIK